MGLVELETFLTVIRVGTLAAAARELHVSQPAISRRLAALEHRIGVELFERIGRNLRLTPAGRLYLPYVERALTHLQDGTDVLRDFTRGGAVSLALVGTLASSDLVAVLRRFHEQHPGLDLRIRTSTSPGVAELVRHGEADVGLMYDLGGPSVPALTTFHTLSEELVPVASQATPPRAAPRPWLVFPSVVEQLRDPYRLALCRHLGVPDLDDVELVHVDSLTAQISLASAGFGAAIIPASALSFSTAQDLERLPTTGRDLRLDVQIVGRPGSIARPPVRNLIDSIRQGWNRPQPDPPAQRHRPPLAEEGCQGHRSCCSTQCRGPARLSSAPTQWARKDIPVPVQPVVLLGQTAGTARSRCEKRDI